MPSTPAHHICTAWFVSSPPNILAIYQQSRALADLQACYHADEMPIGEGLDFEQGYVSASANIELRTHFHQLLTAFYCALCRMWTLFYPNFASDVRHLDNMMHMYPAMNHGAMIVW